jgi:hypothetical protein
MGPFFAEKAEWRGATKENIPGGFSTEEPRSQTAFSAKTLRAAGLLPAAGVGSAVTARSGDAPASPPWPQPKSLAAGPIGIFGHALKSAEPASASLRAYVEKNQRRQAYGVYLKNHKFGWAIDELKPGRHDGHEVAIATFEMQGSFLSGGERTRFEDKSTTCFALDGSGEIVFGEERTLEDNNEITRVAVREGAEMVVTTRFRGGETKRRVPVPRETLRLARALEAWLTKPPKKGAKFEHYSASWNEEKIDTQEVFTYRGRKSVLWGGVKTDVHLVDVNIEGMNAAFEVLSDGTPLRGMLGGLFELRAEEESLAKTPGTTSFDMLLASSIAINKSLGDPEKIESLRLKITGLEGFSIPHSHRQQVRSKRGNTVVLELLRDRRLEKAAALLTSEREPYLKPTPALQSDQPEIRALAAEIAGDETDAFRKASKFQDWIYKNVRQTMAANASSALDVAKNRAGDCTEITLLFVALARAAGIPAREVGGVMYAEEEPPVFGWHAWAEIHDGHQWVSIDPTWNQVYVDAAHMKLTEGTQDWSWVNLLGRMKIQVLKLTTRKP